MYFLVKRPYIGLTRPNKTKGSLKSPLKGLSNCWDKKRPKRIYLSNRLNEIIFSMILYFVIALPPLNKHLVDIPWWKQSKKAMHLGDVLPAAICLKLFPNRFQCSPQRAPFPGQECAIRTCSNIILLLKFFNHNSCRTYHK